MSPKGIDLHSDLSVDELVFLRDRLKVPEEKLRGFLNRNEARRILVRDEQRGIVNHYVEYRTALNNALKRKERLSAGGDLYPRLTEERWGVGAGVRRGAAALMQRIDDAQASVIRSEGPDVFEDAARELTNITGVLDPIIRDLIALDPEGVAPLPVDDPAPDIADAPPIAGQRENLAARAETETRPDQVDGAVPRASFAEREVQRLALIEAEQAKLAGATDALTEQAGALQARLEAEAATLGAGETLRLRTELSRCTDQQRALADRAAALQGYVDSYPQRELIQQEAAETLEELLPLSGFSALDTPDDILAAFTDASEQAGHLKTILIHSLDVQRDLGPELQSASAEERDRKRIAGLEAQNEILRNDVQTAAQTPLPPETRMYLDEPDVMKITPQQAREIDGMIYASERLLEAGHIDEAAALSRSARGVLVMFIGQRSAVPPDVTPATSQFDDLEGSLDRLQVELDRFWGKGGDIFAGDGGAVTRPLQDRLDGMRTALGTAVTDAHLDALAGQIADFKIAFANARRDFVPPDRAAEDIAAAEQAGASATAIRTRLLEFYKTKEISATEITGDADEHLIIIPGEDGDHYHRIETTVVGGKRVPDLKNNSFPRELLAELMHKAETLEGMSETDAPGIGDGVDALRAEARDLLGNMYPPDTKARLFDDIATALRKCDAAAAHPLFEEFEPSNLKAKKKELDGIRAGYATAADPDAVLADLIGTSVKKPDGGLHRAFEEMAEATSTVRDNFRSAREILDNVDKDLSGQSGFFGKNKTIGRALQDTLALREGLADQRDGFVGRCTDEDDQARATAQFDRMLFGIDRMAAVQEEGAGYQGEFLARAGRLRGRLERRLSDDIAAVLNEAHELQTEIRQTYDDMPDPAVLEKFATGEMNAIDAGLDLDELETFAGYLEGAADGAEAVREARDAADASMQAAEERLAEAETEMHRAAVYRRKLKTLFRNRPDHPRGPELTALQGQFADTRKVYEGGGDPAAAQAAFDRIRNGAASLCHLTPTQESEAGADHTTGDINFNAETARTEVQQAVRGLLAAISQLGDDLVTRADDGADKDAARAVKAMLDRAGDLDGAANDIFPAAFAAALTAAAEPENAATRGKTLRQLREQGLAQLRGIETAVSSHPAILLYRSNPSDGLIAWDPFRAGLLVVEARLTKELT